TQEGAAVPFTLPPEAVLAKVTHALESRRPRPRYYVTFPTYLFGYLKRLLTTRALDRLLRRV
ncbi:MAG: short-chain dehydrogenase, partial [Candidatus Sedimenticola endophacoides]